MSAQVAIGLLCCNDRQLIVILFIFATFSNHVSYNIKNELVQQIEQNFHTSFPIQSYFLYLHKNLIYENLYKIYRRQLWNVLFAWKKFFSAGLIRMYFIRMVNTIATSNILKQYWIVGYFTLVSMTCFTSNIL